MKIIWQDPEMLEKYVPPEIWKNRNNSEHYFRLPNGSMVYVLGADKPDSLRGPNPRGVILDACRTSSHKGHCATLFGPYLCGREATEVSVKDFATSAESEIDAYSRQGFGTLLARLGAGVRACLSTPVTKVDFSRRSHVEVETTKGKLQGLAAIITASNSVLAAGKIKFVPELPKPLVDAVNKLSLGNYDHIALELERNPLNISDDALVFTKATDSHTASLLANVSGTAVCVVDVGGQFAYDLATCGEAAMVAFALDWICGLYGSDIKKHVRRSHATRWRTEEWALGAFSAARPGDHKLRKLLSVPVNERLWFAGEAAHETFWGTVGGAWESGQRAAESALALLSRTRDVNRHLQ